MGQEEEFTGVEGAEGRYAKRAPQLDSRMAEIEEGLDFVRKIRRLGIHCAGREW